MTNLRPKLVCYNEVKQPRIGVRFLAISLLLIVLLSSICVVKLKSRTQIVRTNQVKMLGHAFSVRKPLTKNDGDMPSQFAISLNPGANP